MGARAGTLGAMERTSPALVQRLAAAVALITLPFGGACASDAPTEPTGADLAPSPPPNVLIVMTDDQGLGDFSSAGNPVLETPRLDAFAATCPEVERFYVSPVCTPTRASLMTGRWNYRTRAIDTYIGRAMMEPDEVTLAEVLQGAGYRTGIFGKWHLGDCYPLRAKDQGFDVSLVHRGGGLAQPSEPVENGRRYTDAILFEDGEPVTTEGYCTDVYVDRAIEFIDASVAEGAPFFAYVATNAPHDPLHDVPEALYAKYAERDYGEVVRGNGVDTDRIARTYAMIENIDQNFGRLLDHLDERGLARDTLVLFLCDNGPVGGRQVAGLRGSKSHVYEGGIRSPLWVRLPGRVDPAARVPQIAAHVDVFPTVLEACGVAPPGGVKIDGRSLLPLLEGREVEWPERGLVLQAHRGNEPEAEHQFALVQQRWKLLRASGFGRESIPEGYPLESTAPERPLGRPLELYDLQVDPGETNDLADEHPDVVEEMRGRYAAWFKGVSGTREDNYAPPAIRPGTDHEPVTWLTRQDWRLAYSSQQTRGWGTKGHWVLEFDAATELEVTLRFRQPTRVGHVLLYANPDSGQLTHAEYEPDGATVEHLDLGLVTFPAGRSSLQVLWAEEPRGSAGEGDYTGPYQVRLARP